MAKHGFLHFRWRVFAMTLLCLSAAVACVTPPPYQAMSDARQAVSAAHDANAQKLSPELYNESQEHLAKAKRLMSERKFGLAHYHADKARQTAAAALKNAQDSSDR